MAQTKVEQIAAYALRAKYEDLSAESRKQIPVHILDSVGCQIAALGAVPVNACREQVQEFAGEGAVPLIAGGLSNPVYAAFWHTVLVRYVDIMDNIMAPTETAHTADNFGGVLTAAQIADASGKDLMLAVAVSWSIQSLLVEKANFMTKGFDHTTQLAYSVPAAAGKLLGWDQETVANAIAMAAASDVSFAGIRSKPLSMWKGLASGQSTFSAFNALYLAKRGIKGPLAIIEGPQGVENLLGRPIDIDWSKENYDWVPQSTIKKFVAMIHTQSAIECILELVQEQKIDPQKITAIKADVPQMTYDFSGGGLYGNALGGITTKEQADHSLPYLLAVAALDGQVLQPQLTSERIQREDVQSLMKKVTIKPDDEFTKRYPKDFCSRITITTTDGKSLTHEISSYPGMPSHPFTWEDAVDKFDRLTRDVLTPEQSAKIKMIVKDLEHHTTRELFSVLAQISYPKNRKF
ncbi:MmgE/PrpD family protein [Enterococcus hirae]|nr:MmgE/PrpD family protein [Enterococcus hirae]